MTPLNIINAALKGEGKKKQVNKAQMAEALGAVAKYWYLTVHKKGLFSDAYLGKHKSSWIDVVLYHWGKKLHDKEQRAKKSKPRARGGR